MRRITCGEIEDIRYRLGHEWKLGGPLSRERLAAILGLGGQNPVDTVYDWERRRPDQELTGPISCALHMMVEYGPPPGFDS